MNIVELFAGSKTFSGVASVRGHTTFTSDNDPAFGCDYTVDVLKFDPSFVPFRPDILWASPPCESFSVASIGHHWNIDNTPKTENALHGVAMVAKTLDIIKELEPTWYFIENPRGKLRKLPLMSDHLYRHTVTYCQYGDTRMKPTDIWTNCPYWKPRPVCKNGDTCHVAAPRGSRTGTQGIETYFDRSKLPVELCHEILEAVENATVQPIERQVVQLSLI